MMNTDNIQATNILGDHFRKRHDYIKMTLYNLYKWAGPGVKTEVYNLFSWLISQEGLARYERNRQRRAIIPVLTVGR